MRQMIGFKCYSAFARECTFTIGHKKTGLLNEFSKPAQIAIKNGLP